MREDDLVFSAAKLFFAYGLGNAMTFPMSVGATAVLLPERPTPEAVFRTLKQYQPTLFFGVPTLYAAHARLSRRARRRTARSACACASRPARRCPPRSARPSRRSFGVDILDGVGSTEMLHQYVCNSPGDVQYGTSGKPVPGYEVRLVDEQGREVPDGEVGEMLVKGPERRARATGTSARRAAPPSRAAGRAPATSTRATPRATTPTRAAPTTCSRCRASGCRPFEVESALIGHDAVLEAAVVPKEDADGLAQAQGLHRAEARQGGRQRPRRRSSRSTSRPRPACGSIPRWIEFVDGLPKTATGKIQRFKLREG